MSTEPSNSLINLKFLIKDMPVKTISPNLDNITILTELYCEIDEFIKVFQPIFEKHLIGTRRRVAFCRLSICEIMTILVAIK
jgi:hypothetical protein